MRYGLALIAVSCCLALPACSSKEHANDVKVSKDDASKGSEPRGSEDQERTFTVSMGTTYITGPLDEHGRLDFIAAINEHAAKGVTVDNNAAVKLWQAMGPLSIDEQDRASFFKLLGSRPPADEGSFFVPLRRYLTVSLPDLPDGEVDQILEQQSAAVAANWTREQYPRIADWLDSNRASLEIVVEATTRPRYFSPYVGKQMIDPATGSHRYFARALAARALLQIQEGNAELAWRDIMACYRLARLVGSGQGLSNNMSALGIDGIARRASIYFFCDSRRTVEQIRQCRTDLSRLPPLPRLAVNLEFSARLQLLGNSVLSQGGPEPLETLLSLWGGPEGPGKTLARLAQTEPVAWDLVLKDVNRDVDALVRVARVEEPQLSDAHKAYVQRRAALAHRIQSNDELRDYLSNAASRESALAELISSVLSDLVMPAMHASLEAEARGRAANQVASIVFAVCAFRAENGRIPSSLQQLVPKYLPTLPVDRFSGRPARYLPTADGYLIYSVGPNGKDEGGKHRGDAPDYRGDDIRIRVPLDKTSIWP